jgi:nicotinamide phosphoribosyltransferase
MGVGSMSMMALVGQDEDTSKLVFAGEHNGTNCGPYTRDTFGIAVKATYAEDENGNPINIFKQPKAISWKKSQKGCCIVAPDGMSYTDGHTWDEVINAKDNLLEQVFYNGRLAWETDLAQVRRNMYPQETFKI